MRHLLKILVSTRPNLLMDIVGESSVGLAPHSCASIHDVVVGKHVKGGFGRHFMNNGEILLALALAALTFLILLRLALKRKTCTSAQLSSTC